MIPKFPDFKLLGVEDKVGIEQITTQYPPYSDFSFASLLCYDTQNSVQVSILHGNLIVKFSDYLTLEPSFSFLGTNRVPATVEQLLDLTREKQLKPLLRLIPEVSIAGSLGELTGRFEIAEDEDNFDYILSTAKVMRLEIGRTRRKEAIRFVAQHPNYTVTLLNLRDPRTQKQILDLFFRWEEQREKTRTSTLNELTALERAMDWAGDLELLAIGLFLEDQLIGFMVHEKVHGRYSMGHFAKTDLEHAGAALVLRSELAKLLHKQDCAFMNIEQDSGIPGLRTYKRSLRPIGYLRKFTIRAKGSHTPREGVMLESNPVTDNNKEGLVS